MTADLAAAAPSTVAVLRALDRPQPREQRGTVAEYLAAVEAGKEAIRAGEVFQVVLSQRFAVDCPADALDVYRSCAPRTPAPTCTSTG